MSRDQEKASQRAVLVASTVSFSVGSFKDRKKVSKRRAAQIKEASSVALAAATA